MKKLKKGALLVTLVAIPMLSSGKVWLGAGYAMAKAGYSAEAGLAVGAWGLVEGTAYGLLIGGPVGAGVGFFMGA